MRGRRVEDGARRRAQPRRPLPSAVQSRAGAQITVSQTRRRASASAAATRVPVAAFRTAGPGRAPAALAHHQKQRRQIERLAESLFASRGYRGTSVHLVAARAHCSVGHLYNLYGNKMGLYRATLELKMEILDRLVEEAAAQDVSVRRRLEDLLARALAFFEENSAFFRIISAETGVRLWRTDLPFIGSIGRWQSGLQKRLARLLQEGRESGELRAGLDPTLAAVSLIGMVRAHTTEWVLQGQEGSLLDRADGIMDVVLGGLLAREEVR